MLLYLFYLLYMLLPFRLQKVVSLIGLIPPETAKSFGTIFPYLGVVELCALMIAGVQWVRRGFKLYRSDFTFFTYVGVSVICTIWVCLHNVFWGQEKFWYDEIMFIVRLCALYFFFSSLSVSRTYLERALVNALTLLFAAYLILYVFGMRNENLLYNTSDRMNAPGLEVTSTGHLAAVLLCCGVFLERGKQRFLIAAIGMMSLLIAGSRVTCVVSGTILFLGAIHKHDKRLILVLVSCVAAMFMIGTLVPKSVYSKIPLISHFKEEMDIKNEQTDSIRAKLKQYPGGSVISRLSSTGLMERFLAWHVGTSVLLELRGEPAGSDWAVQSRLVEAGFPSHTHSVLLQSFIKYGFLAFVIWVIIVRSLWSGMKTGSPYIYPLLVLVMGGLFDYWFFVDKAAFVFFALMKLNDKWVLESRNHLLEEHQKYRKGLKL